MYYYIDKNNSIFSYAEKQSFNDMKEISFDEVIKITKETDTLTYTEKRKLEYPSIEDYIDGIVKNNIEQVNNYISKCLDIKSKYPKDC